MDFRGHDTYLDAAGTPLASDAAARCNDPREARHRSTIGRAQVAVNYILCPSNTLIVSLDYITVRGGLRGLNHPKDAARSRRDRLLWLAPRRPRRAPSRSGISGPRDCSFEAGGNGLRAGWLGLRSGTQYRE